MIEELKDQSTKFNLLREEMAGLKKVFNRQEFSYHPDQNNQNGGSDTHGLYVPEALSD